MKNIYLLLVLISFGLFSLGQSLDDINEMLGKHDYKNAKEAIDKYLSDPKKADKADGWYYKGRIYNAYSRDSSLSVQDAMKLKQDAFESFKNYQQMDAKSLRMLLENYLSYFDLYNGFFDIGAKAYNSNDYTTGYNGFKNAALVEDYIRSKGYQNPSLKFSDLDTVLVLYTAMAARNAKMQDEAALYYKKLADANVTGENYSDVYEWLADYYQRNKQTPEFNNIIEKGRKLYPQNDLWAQLELSEATEGLKGQALFNKYEELSQRYPNNYVLHYNYAVELYHYVNDSLKNIGGKEYKTKLVDVLNKTNSIKSTIEVNFLTAVFYYYNAVDLAEAARKIKAVKPEDIKRKKDMEAESSKSMNEAIPYAETVLKMYNALTKPKAVDKGNYRTALTILKNIYDSKKDTAKATEMDKKLKEAER